MEGEPSVGRPWGVAA